MSGRTICPALYTALRAAGLASANAGLITDIIACPGLDYCALATARSIPIAQDISERFADPARAEAIGEFRIKISGCINACGHHHVGHVGILGLEKGASRTTRSRWAAIIPRRRPSASAPGRGLRLKKSARRWSGSRMRILRCARMRASVSSMRSAASGREPFKAAIYDREVRDAA